MKLPPEEHQRKGGLMDRLRIWMMVLPIHIIESLLAKATYHMFVK